MKTQESRGWLVGGHWPGAPGSGGAHEREIGRTGLRCPGPPSSKFRRPLLFLFPTTPHLPPNNTRNDYQRRHQVSLLVFPRHSERPGPADCPTSRSPAVSVRWPVLPPPVPARN